VTGKCLRNIALQYEVGAYGKMHIFSRCLFKILKVKDRGQNFSFQKSFYVNNHVVFYVYVAKPFAVFQYTKQITSKHHFKEKCIQ